MFVSRLSSGRMMSTSQARHHDLVEGFVGRLAAAVTGAPYVRHPSHGGAATFEAGLRALTHARAPVRLSA